mgnify:FL=1
MTELVGQIEAQQPIDKVWKYIGRDLGTINRRLAKKGAVRLDDEESQKHLQAILSTKNKDLARNYLGKRKAEHEDIQKKTQELLKKGFHDDKKYWDSKKEWLALRGKTDEILRIRRGELRHQMNETQRGQTLKGMENTKKYIQEVEGLLVLLPQKQELKYPPVPKAPPKTNPLAALSKNIFKR